MVSIWTIASILCLIVAGLLLQRRNFDAAFVLATLGAIAWFLNYRSQIRATIQKETETTLDEAGASEDDDEE